MPVLTGGYSQNTRHIHVALKQCLSLILRIKASQEDQQECGGETREDHVER
jgi:hypothetical protein